MAKLPIAVLGIEEVSVRQRLEDLRVIERGMAIGHFDMPPSPSA
jgi:hypothetical protein